MADAIKQLKDKIWLLKQSIKAEESQREQWATTIPELEAGIAAAGAGSERDEYVMFKEEAVTNVAKHDVELKKLHSELQALQAELPQADEPSAPKFDPEKHPLLRKTLEKQEPEKAVVFSTGDMVEAQWTDKSWYKAKIQSLFGSSSAPKYVVRFVEYDDTMTVDSSAVRPLPSKRKRDPEAAPAVASSTVASSSPHVISGPASVNPSAAAKPNNPAALDQPKAPNKVPNKGILKKRQNAWQDFQAKTDKKNPKKKESMFRTSTAYGSRVGFTGSGKGMTETNKRQRYDREADMEADPEYQAQSSNTNSYRPRKF